jgi:hypothetical protein
MTTEPQPSEIPIDQDPRWAAVVARDRTFDGKFYYSVGTTGVYCRPSLRRPPRQARERRVSHHARRCGKGGLSSLQALQARPALVDRAARGEDYGGLPPHRIGGRKPVPSTSWRVRQG